MSLDMRSFALTAILLTAALLAGCEMLGMESPEKTAAAREADGKAIGGACRHAGRAIEDCYALNRKADRASVFTGWREMNDYMRENKIEAVAPQATTQAAKAGEKVSAEAAGDAAAAGEKRSPKAAAPGKGKAAKGHES
jgi:hypothetical protein